MAAWATLIKETFEKWQADEAPRMGASLAYYAVFSMTLLLIIVIAIIGFVYKGNTVGEIQSQMEALMGLAPAKTVAEAIHNVHTCINVLARVCEVRIRDENVGFAAEGEAITWPRRAW